MAEIPSGNPERKPPKQPAPQAEAPEVVQKPEEPPKKPAPEAEALKVAFHT